MRSRLVSFALLVAVLGLALPAGADQYIRLTSNPADDQWPAWTPDGTSIIFHSNRTGDFRLYQVPATGGVAVQLSFGPGDDEYPTVSPDGSQIAFSRVLTDSLDELYGSIWVVPIGGGTATQLSTCSHPMDLDVTPAWSPDGTTIYFGRRHGTDTREYGIYKVPAAGGATTLVWDPAGAESNPLISPDGLTLYFGSNQGPSPLDIFSMPLASPGSITQVTFDWCGAHDFNSDGSLMLFGSRKYYSCAELYKMDMATMLSHRITFDADSLGYDPGNHHGQFSPGDSLIAFYSRRGGNWNDDIWVLKPGQSSIPPTGQNCPLTQLTFNTTIEDWPSWDADGASLVFESKVTGTYHLYRVPAAGGTMTQISAGTGDEKYPEVSPDGTRIAFSRVFANSKGYQYGSIWVMPAGGGTATQVSTPNHPLDLDLVPAWSADGTTIYFHRRHGDDAYEYGIYQVPAAGGATTVVYDPAGVQANPVISPDGVTFVFAQRFTSSGVMNMYLAPLANPAAAERLLPALENTGAHDFSPDGSTLLFGHRSAAGFAEIYELDLATLTITQKTYDSNITGLDTGNHHGQYSPDGARIAHYSLRNGGDNNIWILDPCLPPDACMDCPPADHDPVLAGDPLDLTFRFCNCGPVAGDFKVRVIDDLGWASTTCDTVMVASGGCDTVAVHYLVPPGAAEGDTNYIRFLVRPLAAYDRLQTCVVRVPVGAPPIAVGLAAFQAESGGDGLTLTWRTAGEVNHACFNLLRSDSREAGYRRLNAAPIVGASAYRYVDGTAEDGRSYWYRLEAVDRNGGIQLFGPYAARFDLRPALFRLARIYPNPFASRLAFTLDLPSAGPVTLRIFDSSGRLVRSLLDGVALEPGRHAMEWDGRDDAGRAASAGSYFLRAESGQGRDTQRLIRVR